ncbi:SDR family NAD(P)-dependent oxidoreductase (plasmid) [Burkholderia sp. FERM BP-3421]|uniref:type I polyketide synthase n=1 Tax=Burkholderia sp. FERM BP-3421 TaxID=1494466 RepID=UPI00235DE08A|nr:type I polyketide synthase [Burkholderia sp. FERM BP-3421]WDD90203.1 SDR family NAD(P)-dependent oxidoreductase [Burkholderia sp. FERM BP-3421]
MTVTDAQSPLVRALSALERSRLKLEAVERERSEPIAIVGAACRLPGGVVDLDSFWTLLERGGDAVSGLPETRWNTTGLFDRNRNAAGAVYSNAMAVLDGADRFDHAAFGISAREAERMEPQQRQLLEVSFEALDHAGLNVEGLRDSDTGVFVGICPNDFTHRFAIESADPYSATGASLATASGRLAYVFGFQGPALSIDTACSSSLVALHLACQALRKRETGLALVGGVHVSAGPESSVALAKLNALSPSGRCRAFSADADGYVRGEGCIVVVLKRLSDAVRDGDRILASVRETAINQDGRSNGLTAPNRLAQTELLRSCLSRAKLKPHDVGYLEAHGTGTELGDPIELAAAATAYGVDREDPLWVGSAKTNIGHLEAGAGLAGLLRAVLALRHATIPPNLHLNGLNPHFDWDAERLRVPTTLTPFPLNPSGSRIAGVSSFGFSGTNAHALVEQAPAPAEAEAPASGEEDAVFLSAASDAGLRDQARRFARRLTETPSRWREVCHTARARSNAQALRIAVAGRDANDLATQLTAFADGAPVADLTRGACLPDGRGVVAVFSGQGAQWVGMGRELYATRGAFADTFDACAQAIERHSGRVMRDALAADEAAFSTLDVATVQPLIFSVAVALAAHLRALGLRFDALVGQSMGEVSAATVAGALSIDDGARIICERSRLGATVKGGAMAMVALSRDEVEARVTAEARAVTLAACNGPASTLVSGTQDEIDALVVAWQAAGVFCRRLRVDYASHSAFMEPLLAPLKAALANIAPRAGALPLYSTVTAAEIDGAALTPDYWAANLRQPVLLYPTLEKLIALGYRLFVEISPRPALSASIEDALAQAGVEGCVVCAMSDGAPQQRTALLAAGLVFAHGARLEVRRTPAWMTEIPARSWDHVEFPLPAYRRTAGVDGRTDAILDAPRMIAGQTGVAMAEGSVSIDHPLVAQHRVDGSALLPGMGFLSLVLRAARARWPTRNLSLTEVAFRQVLAVRDDAPAPRSLQLVLVDQSPDAAGWRMSSRDDEHDERWIEHASGNVAHDAGPLDDAGLPALAEVRARLHDEVDGVTLYDALDATGLQYGPRFRRVARLGWGDNAFVAQLAAATEPEGGEARLDAFSLDACLHGLAWLGSRRGEHAQVPVSVASVAIAASAGAPAWVYGVRTGDGAASTADLVVWDAAGRVIARIVGLRALNPDRARASLPAQGRWLHAQTWIEQPIPVAEAAAARDWLIVAANGDVSGPWLARLQACLGATLLPWRAGEHEPFPMAAFRAWAQADGDAAREVVWLGDSVERALSDDCQGEPTLHASIDALAMAQAMLGAFDGRPAPRLTFVSAGAQSVAGGAPARATLGDAGLWGFARAVSAEHAHWRLRCIDLDPADIRRQADRLADELVGGGGETEVALREARWVGRLARQPLGEERAASARLAGEPYRVQIDRPGVLGSLTLRATQRLEPAPGEVEIEIDAAALNFADVMRAMGFFLGEQEHRVTLGSECAGIVSRVGPGVSGIRMGQPVVAIGAHCFASHVCVDAALVATRPDTLSAADAAGLPIASMTAWYALKEVASLRAGERVLIHSASGGTGLAAVQLALSIGAEVIATAGSESKREMLRGMGVRHVFDSRSAAFERATLDATGGQGVDVVLNSLTGVAIEQNLRVLAADGWFLELGKRDIYEDGRLSLRHFKKRIRFVAIDLSGLQRERPEQFAALFRRVMDAFVAGAVAPLPTTIVPVSRAAEAFQRMASAQHVGKLVLTMRDPDITLAEPGGTAPLLRGTHLITGGTGGLGAALAGWLVENGVRRIVLIGRSAEGEAGRALAERLRRQGAEVRTVALDVTSRAALARELEAIEAGFGPLRGVYHLAGVLRDGLVDTQTPDAYRHVLEPKVDGAWHLHELTAGRELDHFVLYSSAAALLPSPSQASYAAANAFLDALASHRRASGLPALSVQWGPFSDAGLAAARDERGARLAERGAASLTTGEAHGYLGMLMKCDAPVIGVFPFDAARWLEASTAVAAQPRFDALRSASIQRPGNGTSRDLLEAASPDARLAQLQSLVRRHAAAVLRVSEAALTPSTTFPQMGLDSLTGLELRNRIEGEVGMPLSSAVLWRHPTTDALAECLAQQFGAAASPAAALAPATAPLAAVPSKAEASDAGKWFLVPRASQSPRLKLFCIPFLGGLSSVFSGWLRYLPDDIDLQALQLPGRPPRHTETAYAKYPALIEKLRDVLIPSLNAPYAIYGHSLGALLAFGLAHALRDAGAPAPEHLFLAAYPSPHLHNPVGDIAGLPETEFIDALKRLRGIPEQVLADRELLTVFLPSLRAEIELLNSYVHTSRAPLAVPATILGGTRDHVVSAAEIRAWRQHFAGPVEVRDIEGGHYFMKDASREVVGVLLARLALAQPA